MALKWQTFNDVTNNNPAGVVYFIGSEGFPEAWRGIIIDPPDKLSFEHFEPATEIDIILDEAKVISVEGNPVYTSADPYFASVLTDSRTNQSTPAGISGDMAGRFVEWDGFLWQNFDEQWVEKGFFAESFFSDRGVFQRMNVIETDPNDATRHPPQPPGGTSLGARNTQADGLGIEFLSFNDKNGHFGQMLEFLHGGEPELVDQLQGTKIDTTLIGVPFELGHIAGDTYAIGDIVVDQGVRFICNTDGVQVGIFLTETSKWDAVNYGNIFNVDDILTSTNGSVLVNAAGNVLLGS